MENSCHVGPLQRHQPQACDRSTAEVRRVRCGSHQGCEVKSTSVSNHCALLWAVGEQITKNFLTPIVSHATLYGSDGRPLTHDSSPSRIGDFVMSNERSFLLGGVPPPAKQ